MHVKRRPRRGGRGIPAISHAGTINASSVQKSGSPSHTIFRVNHPAGDDARAENTYPLARLAEPLEGDGRHLAVPCVHAHWQMAHPPSEMAHFGTNPCAIPTCVLVFEA